MSAPGPECVVCGKVALALTGWDGGFPSYRQFRALWDPPRVFQDMVHFSCLRTWEHRDEMLTELVDLATGSVLEFDIEFNGQRHHITRSDLGYPERRLETDEILVLQHQLSADWLIVDFSGAWQFIGRNDILRLVRGEPAYDQGGRGRYGLTLSPAPTNETVNSWVLGDLLQHLGINSRYPGLAESDATLRIDEYRAEAARLVYTVDHPLTIHPKALDYFRAEYERSGEAAFASFLDSMSDE